MEDITKLKYHDQFLTDSGKIIRQYLDTYNAELCAMIELYKNNYDVNITDYDIWTLYRRCQKLADACAELLKDTNYNIN